MTTFVKPVTAFQENVLARLFAYDHALLRSAPTVVQVPYTRPTGGGADQFLIVEWPQTLTIYLYGDEVGLKGFTLEREDYRTDEAQILGMIDEIERLLTSAR